MWRTKFWCKLVLFWKVFQIQYYPYLGRLVTSPPNGESIHGRILRSWCPRPLQKTPSTDARSSRREAHLQNVFVGEKCRIPFQFHNHLPDQGRKLAVGDLVPHPLMWWLQRRVRNRTCARRECIRACLKQPSFDLELPRRDPFACVKVDIRLAALCARLPNLPRYRMAQKDPQRSCRLRAERRELDTGER